MTTSVDVLIVGGGATGAGVLRDLSRRGLHCLLVEKGALGSGTSGRYHGLLHSGSRYAVSDPTAARECIQENQVLRRIAAQFIEDTGGYVVSTSDDPDDYADAFQTACDASGIPCDEVSVAELLRREPAVAKTIKRGFFVPDASLHSAPLIVANVMEAQQRGSDAWPDHRLDSLLRDGDRIVGGEVRNMRTGEAHRIEARAVVSSAGAWAGPVAALAGIKLDVVLGKGSMVVYRPRIARAVLNRCHPPGDGDLLVPVDDASVIGTTDSRVDDPDDPHPTDAEIATLVAAGAKLIPELATMTATRAYAGVRPLYGIEASDGETGGRSISRSHVVIDHAARDGVEGFVSIVGGKVTTYRLMAEEAGDLVSAKLGVSAACTTSDEPLPAMSTAADVNLR